MPKTLYMLTSSLLLCDLSWTHPSSDCTYTYEDLHSILLCSQPTLLHRHDAQDPVHAILPGMLGIISGNTSCFVIAITPTSCCTLYCSAYIQHCLHIEGLQVHGLDTFLGGCWDPVGPAKVLFSLTCMNEADLVLAGTLSSLTNTLRSSPCTLSFLAANMCKCTRETVPPTTTS